MILVIIGREEINIKRRKNNTIALKRNNIMPIQLIAKRYKRGFFTFFSIFLTHSIYNNYE